MSDLTLKAGDRVKLEGVIIEVSEPRQRARVRFTGGDGQIREGWVPLELARLMFVVPPRAGSAPSSVMSNPRPHPHDELLRRMRRWPR